jgi:hypothetical protein
VIRGACPATPGRPGGCARRSCTPHEVQLAARVCLSDLVQERQELLVPVPGIAGVGDLAGGHLQGGERRAGAVPDVVLAASSGILGRSGGGFSVASTIATSPMVRGLPGLGRSSSPPVPSGAYRFYCKITVGLYTPVRRAMNACRRPPS